MSEIQQCNKIIEKQQQKMSTGEFKWGESEKEIEETGTGFIFTRAANARSFDILL